ncbi:MAG: hypothetical protein AAEJ65_03605 [Planctomycetota bacterium]
MLSEPEHKRIQIRDLARELSEILGRIDQLHEQQSQVLVDLDEAAMAADYSALAQYRQREGRLLSRIIDEERQRLIVSEELGDVIGLEIPSKLAIDDVVPLVPEALAVKLTALRDRIQKHGYALRAQNRLAELLVGHTFEHVEVFLSPGAQNLVCDDEPNPATNVSEDPFDPSF